MIRLEAVSETSLIIYFNNTDSSNDDGISTDLATVIGRVSETLRSEGPGWLVEVIPSYTSIFIEYDLWQVDFLAARRVIREELCEWLDIEMAQDLNHQTNGQLIELPVYYHPDVAPDLLSASKALSLSPDELVALHTRQEYRVCAIGFAPGFAFLASVDPRLHIPRKPEPRKSVMAGSVGLAGPQTAVYPSDSPGGWQIIGNCPQPLFLPDQTPVTPFTVGDRVRFYAISCEQYKEQGGVDWHGG